MDSSLKEKEQQETEQFKHTLIYRGMKAEVQLAKDDISYYKKMYEETEKELVLLKSEVRKHPDDGSAKNISIEDYNLSELQKKYDMAQDKIRMQEHEIVRLKKQINNILYELHPEDMPRDWSKKTLKKPVGRPSIGSGVEFREAQDMKRNGYSVSEIAESMGWSVGFTQGKVKGVKVDPEKRKQHLAERRKNAK